MCTIPARARKVATYQRIGGVAPYTTFSIIAVHKGVTPMATTAVVETPTAFTEKKKSGEYARIQPVHTAMYFQGRAFQFLGSL